MEGVSRHGRAAPICRPPARGREDGAAVRRVRDLAQDRLQDLRPVQGLRRRGVHRSQPAARIARRIGCRPPIEAIDRPTEARVSRLGRAEDPREAAPAARSASQLPAISTVHAVLDRHGLVHRRRRRRGRARRHHPVPPDRAERAVVRGLQRRVHARQSPLLLSADDHRLRQPLLADLRGAVDDAGEVRLHRLRAHVQGVWAAAGDPDRQRRALRVRPCDLRAQQAVRLVAPSRDSDRAHHTRPSATKRPARADASDA